MPGFSPTQGHIASAIPYPNNNPDDYEIARLKLASLILGRDIAAGREFAGRIEGPPQEATVQITNY